MRPTLSLILLASLLAFAGCKKTHHKSKEMEEDKSFKSAESPGGLRSDVPQYSSTPKPDSPAIAMGACRLRVQLESNTEKGFLVTVNEVLGYGPNFNFTFIKEGETLRVSGADSGLFEKAKELTLEVQPVENGRRDEAIRIVQYVNTVE